MPSAEQRPSGRVAARKIERTAERAGVVARAQAVLVLVIAAAPLTAAGHYFANRVSGEAGSASLTGLLWLPVFAVLGLGLSAAGLSTLVPRWHKTGGPARIASLAGGLLMATVDWSLIVGSRSGLALNAAGAGVAVGSILGAISAHRTAITRISPRGSELVIEWFGSLLVFGAALSLALPHQATIEGVTNDCSPMWAVLEVRCWSPDTPWWPFPVAAAILGVTVLKIVRTDPLGTAP